MAYAAALRRLLSGGAVALVLAATGPYDARLHAEQQTGEPRVNRDAQLIAEFTKAAEAYVEIHRKADASVPEIPPTGTPEQVAAHERVVAQLIEKARANAKQGDVFTRDIRAHFRRQIGRVLTGPEGAELKAAIMEENPGAIPLRVNGRYPETLPVTTMPPQILAVVPKLPKELEYRFIARRLVLLDAHAQLIVDYIDDAIPR